MIWRPIPLRNVILEFLEKNRVVLLDKLLNYVRQYYPDVSEHTVLKTLLELETKRKITFVQINKKQRKVELI